MANQVQINLTIKGELDKYGLNRRYLASSFVDDTFDDVAQETITIQGSDAAGGNPTLITGGLTYDAGDIIYVENTSTQYLVVLYVYDDLNTAYHAVSGIKAQQGIAIIATGTGSPQLAIESSLGTITANVVVFRSSV